MFLGNHRLPQLSKTDLPNEDNVRRYSPVHSVNYLSKMALGRLEDEIDPHLFLSKKHHVGRRWLSINSPYLYTVPFTDEMMISHIPSRVPALTNHSTNIGSWMPLLHSGQFLRSSEEHRLEPYMYM